MVNVFKVIDGERVAYIKAKCDKEYIEKVIRQMGYGADIDWLIEKLMTNNIEEANFTDECENAIEVII